MPIKYVGGTDKYPIPVPELGPFGDWPRAENLRRDAREETLCALQQGSVKFFIQKLNIPESVLEAHNRAWVDTWRPTDWPPARYYLNKQGNHRKLLGDRKAPDGNSYIPYRGAMIPDKGQEFEWTVENYEAEFQKSIDTGFYSNGVTDVAIIEIGDKPTERELLEAYLESAQTPDDDEVIVSRPSPDMRDYEPFPRPTNVMFLQPTFWERFTGTHTKPYSPELELYEEGEKKRRAAYRYEQQRQIEEEYARRVTNAKARRHEENPDDLPGFTVIYASWDEVFAEDKRYNSLKISDEVMLHLVSGHTVLVGEPGDVTQMIVPLKKKEAEELGKEKEI